MSDNSESTCHEWVSLIREIMEPSGEDIGQAWDSLIREIMEPEKAEDAC